MQYWNFIEIISNLKLIFLNIWYFFENISTIKPIFYRYWYDIRNIYTGCNIGLILDQYSSDTSVFLLICEIWHLNFTYPEKHLLVFEVLCSLRHPVLRCLSQFRYNNNLTLPLILWCSKVQEHWGVRSANFKGRRLVKKFRATNLKKDVMKCEKWFGK